MKRWNGLDLQRPTWIDRDTAWRQSLAVTDLEPYTFAELDALPQSGDRATTHGMLFEFEVVDLNERCGRFVRHDHKWNGEARSGYLTRGFHIRNYRMHRVARWRDVFTVPLARAEMRLQALWCETPVRRWLQARRVDRFRQGVSRLTANA